MATLSYLLTAALASSSPTTYLDVTSNAIRCEKPKATDILMPDSVYWNPLSKEASFERFGKTFHGKVLAIRPHDEGFKVNLGFPSVYGNSNQYLEFAVFTGSKEGVRIIGMQYTQTEGNRLLDSLEGNAPLKCEMIESQ